MNDHTTVNSNHRGPGAVRGSSDGDNLPPQIEYHKGEPCPYANVLCQEGYCLRCALRGKE